MWFLAPHLKQILKKSLLCWAICFLVASVIGIYSLVKEGQISSFLFILFKLAPIIVRLRYFQG
jgi:hypothetical protein